MSHTIVHINDTYIKKDGTCAVYIFVHIHRVTCRFPTGVNCAIEQFNAKLGRVKGSTKKIKDLNLLIEKAIGCINEIFVRYRLLNEELTPELLKKEWKNPTRRVDFYKWMDEAIDERKGDIANSSIKQHKALKSKMMEFRKKLTFTEIDSEFIEKFRRFLKVKRGNDLNTIHNNLKNLKAYLNIAKRQGIIKENPFQTIALKRSATERIYLTDEELTSLWLVYEKKSLPKTHHYVLRHFLFMCFTGIRISDMLELDFKNIASGKLVYFPVKTKGSKKTGVKVPLIKQSRILIMDEGKTEGKLFDCISEQRTNLKIKDIAGFAGIPKKLSNHCARHTFATMYLHKTKDVAGLQKMLGHSSITQTMVYVHMSEKMVEDNMLKFSRGILKEKKSVPIVKQTFTLN